MSKRKNGVIFIAIVLLCMVLLTQLLGDTSNHIPSSFDNDETTGLDNDPQAAKGNDRIELTAVVFMEPEEFQLLTAWNKEFEQQHTGTTVELTNVSKQDAYQYLIDLARNGESSDIMLLDNTWVSEFAALGYLSHRTSEFSPDENGKSRLDQALGQVKWNGYVWAIPRDVDPYVAVWNPTLFERDGKAELPDTIEQWMERHQSLISDNEQYKGIYADLDDPQAFISLIWAFGGEWSDSSEHMYTIQPSDNETVLDKLLSVETIEGKATIKKPLLNLQKLTPSQSWDRFSLGEFSVMFVRASDLIRYGTDLTNVSTVLVNEAEARQNKEGLWLSGTSYAVSSETLQQEAAYAWIIMMTDMTRQLKSFDLTNKLSASISSMDTEKFRQLFHSEEIKKAVESGRAWSADPKLPGKLNLLRNVMNDLFSAEWPPSEWNEQLQRQWSEQ